MVPAGILLIIFGGINIDSSPLMLILGIIGLVIGFYGCPFCWIAFSGLSPIFKVYRIIKNNRANSINEICSLTKLSEDKVKEYINDLIVDGYIISKFDDNGNLTTIQNVVVCKSCGAKNLVSGTIGICTYCGKPIQKD
jgi:hypothetical protein